MSKLNKRILKKNGIFISMHASMAKIVPDHIDSVRKTLKDFSCTIESMLKLHEDMSAKAIDAKLDEMNLSRDEQNHIRDKIKKYRSLAEEAATKDSSWDHESAWRRFYRSRFFDPLYEQMQPMSNDSRSSPRTKFYYDLFEIHEDRHWTTFRDNGPFHERRKGLTAPQPDWGAYFPIYDLAKPYQARVATQCNWGASAEPSVIGAFSRERLESLVDQGLECHVAAVLKKGRRQRPVPADMFTFPWLAVEHKKNRMGGNYRECYYQAANIASCALLMLEKLAECVDPLPHAAHIPPMVTITTVGKEVKMWIGYVKLEDGEYVHENHCMWTGDMTKIADIMRFESLLENIHTWAMRELRPWISNYLERWSQDVRRKTEPGEAPDYPKRRNSEEYIHYGFKAAQASLRRIVVAEHDGIVERLEQAIAGHLRRRTQVHASTQTDLEAPEPRNSEMAGNKHQSTSEEYPTGTGPPQTLVTTEATQSNIKTDTDALDGAARVPGGSTQQKGSGTFDARPQLAPKSRTNPPFLFGSIQNGDWISTGPPSTPDGSRRNTSSSPSTKPKTTFLGGQPPRAFDDEAAGSKSGLFSTVDIPRPKSSMGSVDHPSQAFDESNYIDTKFSFNFPPKEHP